MNQNKITRKLNKTISEQVSPEALEKVLNYTRGSRRYNALANKTLETTTTVTKTLENGVWVFKTVGKLAEFANKPATATYNNIIKPFYRNEVVEMSLGEEGIKSNLLTALDYAGKASSLASDKKLTERIEKITAILTKLDKYAGKMEWWTNHLRNLQLQDVREQEFSLLNDVESVKATMNNLNNQEVDKLLGIKELEQMKLEEEGGYQERKEQLVTPQFLNQPLPGAWKSLENSLSEALADELDKAVIEQDAIDKNWENINWSSLRGEVYEYHESKIWQLLRKTNNVAIGLNNKIKEYSELAEMVRQLLTEIESIKVSGSKKTDDWVLRNILSPIIKRLGKQGKNIGELIDKGWLAEDARWLASFIEKYNDKVKLGSKYINKGTSFLTEQLEKQNQKKNYHDFEQLNKVPYARDKEDILVFEEELEVVEKPKAEIVEEKPKGWLSGWWKK